MAIKSKKVIGYRFTTIKRWFREPVLSIQIQWEIVGTYISNDPHCMTDRKYVSPVWRQATTEDLIELYKFIDKRNEP